MSHQPATTVQITFQTPSHGGPARPSFHERSLEGVPASTAQQMARDFETYKVRPSAAERQKLYTFRQVKEEGTAGDEAVIALDFGEVVALRPADEEEDTEAVEIDRAFL